MNSISKTPGVYVLIFYLHKKMWITFDKKGSKHYFDRGWYAYVGSARGPGGLHSRVARHQRRSDHGKRMHWNVDYFREHAVLREVWYGKTDDPQTEHTWAKTMGTLRGAGVPVEQFGASDCSAGCRSHFFYFSDQPRTSEFRGRLQNLNDGLPVFVEIVDGKKGTSRKWSSLVAEYYLGRQFLEQRRLAVAEGPIGFDDLKSLAKGRPGRFLAEQVVKNAKVSFPRLKAAIEFSEAVETIMENCGSDSFDVLFDSKRPQARKAIMQISRTSDTRQQYRFHGVVSGRFRSIGPSNDDTVFDTVDFTEVLKRLFRARGAIQKLNSEVKRSRNIGVRCESQRLSRLCMEAARTLKGITTSTQPNSQSVPHGLRKEVVMPVLRERSAKGTVVGLGRLALRLTVKNVWDHQEMVHRDILPTEDQRKRVRQEVQLIVEAAKAIRQTVEYSHDVPISVAGFG
ncbi:GIY-YIG nuclease family protein [Bremerella sp. T1]|uniref:GIY-YIG nuclease family protein n=1 Tax=Bremerella sp. TYQ1 TaxID=3119568 RepID=UPI001CCA28D9|nr:GIY-YIG nuclease family protein [Bremerella volcania]UBM33733.1 GIY-YIG nuclease family protein [Bremerella volcania]